MNPHERLIPRREIPATIRRMTGGAKKPHEATVWRWYTKGVKGVTLDVERIGGEVFTTERALLQFFAETKAATKSRRRREQRPIATGVSNARASAMLAARGL